MGVAEAGTLENLTERLVEARVEGLVEAPSSLVEVEAEAKLGEGEGRCRCDGATSGTAGTLHTEKGLKTRRPRPVKTYVIATCPLQKDGKKRDLASNPFRLSFLFRSCGLRTLYSDFVPHN